jgi:hypothetical protein
MTRPGKINRLSKYLRASLRPIGNNGSYTIPLVATALLGAIIFREGQQLSDL